MSYVDLHCHLLPGLDDGPPTFAGSMALVEAAWEAGTRRMVATPHMFQASLGSDDVGEVAERFSDFEARFTKHVAEARTATGDEHLEDLTLSLGAENYVGEPFLSALAEGKVLTLGGSRYLLLEFWPTITATTANQAIQAVQERGFRPVLAHVERYGFLQSRPERLADLVAAGCAAQANAAAILGRQGLRIAQFTDGWLRDGLIAVVASDAHDTGARQPRLDRVDKHLRSRYGDDTAVRCLQDNPRAILADEPTALPTLGRKPWWRR